MYKVLIVDDFLIDRENMKDVLANRSEFPEVEVVGESENGSDALEQIAYLQPDIIISDIEMPLMNGFELAKQIRRDFPSIKLIFCTMYSEFQYVKKALYLGGYGYILKPIDPIELKEAIKNVTMTLSNESKYSKDYLELRETLYHNKPIIIESIMKDLIFGMNKNDEEIWERIDYLQLPLGKDRFMLTLIEIDDFTLITKGYNTEQKQIFSLKVQTRMKNILTEYINHLLIKIDDSHLALIHSFNSDLNVKECGLEVSRLNHYILNEFSVSDISLSMSVSECRSDIIELHQLYEQCLYISRFKYSMGKGKMLFNHDIPSHDYKPNLNFNEIQKEIRYLINAGSHMEIENYVNQLFNKIDESIIEKQEYRNLCFGITLCLQNAISGNKSMPLELLSGSWINFNEILQFETAFDFVDWIRGKLNYVNDQIQIKEHCKNSKIAQKVKNYVELNYNKDLSLEVISEQLFYSPNYLNYIFKQVTGETIFDFAVQYRVNKAKEMLTGSSVKLYEIADLLGYSHTAYFSKLFKKHTGLTPIEYRTQYMVT